MKKAKRLTCTVGVICWTSESKLDGIRETAPERGKVERRWLMDGKWFLLEGDYITYGPDGNRWICEKENYSTLYENL